MLLKLDYDSQATLVNQISEILESARDEGKEGAVGRALVGAKLDMRYEGVEITREFYEIRGDQFGCYHIGDSVIFVLASLNQRALEVLIEFVETGKRVFVLAPSRLLPTCRKLFEEHKTMHIATNSIEAFIATTLEELSGYRSELIGEKFSELIGRYNASV